jgi:site-specific recombinase XerD
MNKLIQQFLDEFDGSPNTIAMYKETIRLFFRWMINTKRDASTPTRIDVIQYKKYLESKKHTAKTVDNYMNSLKSFFKWTNNNSLYEDIARHIKSDAAKFEMLKDPLTVAEMRTLLNYCSIDTEVALRNRAIIHLLYFCGLRVVEVSRLTFSDYKPKTSTLLVIGKGRKSREEIYLPSIAAAAINDYVKHRYQNETYIHTDTPLFLSYAANQRNKLIGVSKAVISTMVTKYLIATGLKTKKISAHSLRHSIAIHMIDEGASLYDVTMKLRHTDANMSRIYTRYIEKKKVRENEPFERITLKYSQTIPSHAV